MEPLPPDSPNPYASPVIPTNDDRPLVSNSPNKPNEPLLEPIPISGTISFNDSLLALRMAKKRVRYGCWGGIAAIILSLVMLMLAILQYLRTTSLSPIVGRLKTFFTTLPSTKAFLIVASIIVVWIILYIRNRKNLKQPVAPQPKLEGTVAEDQFAVTWTDTSATVKWSAFSRYLVSERVVVLLYKDSANFFLFTKDLFQNQHDWQCFLGLLNRKLPRG